MRTYQNISKPTIGDVYQALEAEGQDTDEDLLPLIKDQFTFPTLYVVMDFLEDQG